MLCRCCVHERIGTSSKRAHEIPPVPEDITNTDAFLIEHLPDIKAHFSLLSGEDKTIRYAALAHIRKGEKLTAERQHSFHFLSFLHSTANNLNKAHTSGWRFSEVELLFWSIVLEIGEFYLLAIIFVVMAFNWQLRLILCFCVFVEVKLCMFGAGGERAYNVLRGEVHMGEGRAGDHSMASARYNLGVIPSVNTARVICSKKKGISPVCHLG
jgi:hypothetical protein